MRKLCSGDIVIHNGRYKGKSIKAICLVYFVTNNVVRIKPLLKHPFADWFFVDKTECKLIVKSKNNG